MSTSPTDGAITAGRRQLAGGLLISAVVAAVILVAAVLPAEYGIDPLRIGRLLGLTALRPAGAAEASTAPQARPSGTLTARQVPAYRADTREVTLAPGKGLEVKTRLEKGATLAYSWRTRDGAKVLHDFHGDPLGAKNDEFESFIKDAEAHESRGYLVAPFTGSHGWYWKNKTAAPVTIELQLSGFYTDIFNP